MAYTTIDKPSDYFNTKLYTGNGGTQSITGVGFQPDWVWIKSRTEGYGHSLFDAVRGVTKAIASEGTGAEYTFATGLTAFGSDGFTLGSGTVVNNNSQNHASWNWKAGGSASSNTDGSITSTVSANTTAGFSIVSYTGTGSSATVGHGLGVAPKFMIIKNRSDATNWNVYTTVIDGSMDYLYLNLTDAKGNSSASLPTSTLLNLTASNDVNGSSDNMIAYCFAEKQGYSKFGSYTGNGNADGTFVYTGFKPAFVLLKNANGTYNWNIQDNKRDPYNPVQGHLAPNNSAAEADSSSYYVDFLSNGFKIRNNLAVWNGSGNTLIYMAFAESPFVTSTGIPTTARWLCSYLLT